MQQNRTNTPINAGAYAAHIFGGTKKISESEYFTKSKRVPATREQKVTFTSLTENVKPVCAILPFINSAAFAETMDNYRLYIANYNTMVKEINILIDKENAKIALLRTNNQLTEVQKEFSAIFYKRNSFLKAKEFNNLADEFNAQRGPTIEKKKFRTVKYATEIIFQQMIYTYSTQLAKYSTQLQKLAMNESTPVRQMELNAHFMASSTRNGVAALNVCKATIRNHRAILEEAGVLVDYLYRGHRKGVKSHINSQILVVFDAKTQILTVPDNQRFISRTCKDFSDKNEVTRTSISINKRENSKADFPLGTASPTVSFSFYKNIPAQEEKSKLGGGEKTVKVSEKLSEKLKKSLQNDANLSSQLANGDFFNYNRMDLKYLYNVALYGSLDREEFLEVIKNEFFKNLSKIYRKSTPYAGSYQKAMNAFADQFYYNNGKGKFIVRKELMVDILHKFNWMIDYAQRWFAKTGVRPLNPHDYLDKTRNHKKEIGFYYLEKFYKKHLIKLESKPVESKKIEKTAALRKIAIANQAKYHRKISDVLHNRISISEFIDYVDNNLPPKFMQNASDDLIKEMAKNPTKYNC